MGMNSEIATLASACKQNGIATCGLDKTLTKVCKMLTTLLHWKVLLSNVDCAQKLTENITVSSRRQSIQKTIRSIHARVREAENRRLAQEQYSIHQRYLRSQETPYWAPHGLET
jgi:hypothetical protein